MVGAALGAFTQPDIVSADKLTRNRNEDKGELMDLRTQYVKILRNDANDPIYAPDTRAKLKQAAEDLEAGRIAPEHASNLSLGATLTLIRAFQTGEAFASSVPSETIEARKAYVAAQIDQLLPTLQADGRTSSITALEGIRASGNWAEIGTCFVVAKGTNDLAEHDAKVRARVNELIKNIR